MRLHELESELRAGKKVRRKSWSMGQAVGCQTIGKPPLASCLSYFDANGRVVIGDYAAGMGDLFANDWEPVTPPDPCDAAWEKARRLARSYAGSDILEYDEKTRAIFDLGFTAGREAK